MTCACGDILHQRIALVARSPVCDSLVPSGPPSAERATVFGCGPCRAPAGSQCPELSKHSLSRFFCRGSALRAGADQPTPSQGNPEFSVVRFGMSVEVGREWVSLSFALRTYFTYILLCFFPPIVPLRSPPTSGTSQDAT